MVAIARSDLLTIRAQRSLPRPSTPMPRVASDGRPGTRVGEVECLVVYASGGARAGLDETTGSAMTEVDAEATRRVSTDGGPKRTEVSTARSDCSAWHRTQ